MKNPWSKKNPFLSLWLSGAHAVIGRTRSGTTAEARRQSSTAVARGTKQVADF